jgi:hypothetical protein
MNTVEKLIQFANQKPGLSFADYGDRKIYFAEMREITKDLHDFRELLKLAFVRLGSDLDQKLTEYLCKNSGRLTMNGPAGELNYCTGQYFPTEYRPSAIQALKSIIWDDLREEKDKDGNYLYNTGDTLRAFFKPKLSRRCFKNYIGN